MNIRIVGGRVIDPARNIDRVEDVCVSQCTIVDADSDFRSCETIDASGLWVAPGLIDAHVHLREPGQEHKENIESGLRAAAAGGFTAVLPMPNTEPANDSPKITRMMIKRATQLNGTRIYPVAAVTEGRKGLKLASLASLAKAGAVAFSDDGSAVADDKLMKEALEQCKALGMPLCQHSEDPTLSAGGVIHLGEISKKLGLRGWPAEAEEKIIARDIALAEEIGAHLHVSHISTRGSVDLVRRAKARGVKVTAEVTPHHLFLTDEAALSCGTQAKVNPPLRSKDDKHACIAALADGTIDMVASDHAPHTVEDKSLGWERSAFGIVGLETSLSLMLRLVEEKLLSPIRLIEVMSAAPARVFSLPGGSLAKGAIADIAIIDPKSPCLIDVNVFKSKGRNTPFAGWSVPGRAVCTIVSGNLAFRV